MSLLRTLTASAAIAVMVSACQQGGYNQYGQPNFPTIDKQTATAALGAIGGAVAGSQFGDGRGQIATTAVGTLLGAYLGSELGSSLDRADNTYARQAAGQAFGQNQQTAWRNPQNGNRGVITPTRTVSSNQYGNSTCREFEQTIYVGGKSERAYGTACRQQDGSWKIVK